MTSTDKIKGIVERLGALRRYLWHWCQAYRNNQRRRKDICTRFLEQSQRSRIANKKSTPKEKMGRRFWKRQCIGRRIAISLLIIFDPFFLGSQAFNYDFGFFCIVPKIRSKCFFFFVCNFYLFGINVKDTSSTHQDALQYL